MELLSKNANNEVVNLSKDDLINLLKEIRELSKLDAPRHKKQSKLMKKLFLLEKRDSNYWSDQYYAVLRAIEGEILYRIRKDNW